jgi:hypothetical protein
MVSLQVLPHSQLFFPSKTWFFGIYLNFQLQFNLIFNEEIIQYSRTFVPQVQTP